ncbi:MAG: hypothetical protein KDI48_17850 [Xanthomonadales bacterium]|nr:hypothetical protein [Xanthomonadales bacterium]
MAGNDLGHRSMIVVLGLCLSPALLAYPACGEIQPVTTGQQSIRGVWHPPTAGSLELRFTVEHDGSVSDLQLIEQRWEGRIGEAPKVLADLLQRVSRWQFAPREDQCTRTLQMRYKMQ